MTEDEERRSASEGARQAGTGTPPHERPVIDARTTPGAVEPEVHAAEAALSSPDPAPDEPMGAGSDENAPASASHVTAHVTAHVIEPGPDISLGEADAGVTNLHGRPMRSADDDIASPIDVAGHRSTASGGAAGRGTDGGAVPALLGIVIVILLAALAYLVFTQPDAGRIAALDSDLTGVKTKVAALEARPDAAANLRGRLDAADSELAALKNAVATVQTKVGTAAAADVPDVAAKVAALDGRIADLTRDVATVRTSIADLPKPDDSAMTSRIDALDARVKPLEAEQMAAKTPGRVTEARQNGSAAEAKAAPLAVTAQAVSRAIEAGRPFASDVSVLQSLGTEPRLLQPLQAVAADGAPSLSDLRNDLAGLRDRIVAGSTPTPSGSYLDRLLAGAGTLVRVRPLGSVSGDTPSAIVARMDASIGTDELEATLADWQKLPEAARTASKGLTDRIRLRLAAETAARTIAANAIGAMATSPQ